MEVVDFGAPRRVRHPADRGDCGLVPVVESENQTQFDSTAAEAVERDALGVDVRSALEIVHGAQEVLHLLDPEVGVGA